jgi:hypothetical protein
MGADGQCTGGGAGLPSPRGQRVAIFVPENHALLQLKRALDWERIGQVRVKHWRAAGKNVDGGPGMPWPVSFYGPLLVLRAVKVLNSRQREEDLDREWSSAGVYDETRAGAGGRARSLEPRAGAGRVGGGGLVGGQRRDRDRGGPLWVWQTGGVVCGHDGPGAAERVSARGGELAGNRTAGGAQPQEVEAARGAGRRGRHRESQGSPQRREALTLNNHDIVHSSMLTTSCTVLGR